MLDEQAVVSNRVKKILVVEDDEATGEVIQMVLAEEDSYSTFLVADPEEVLEVASSIKPNLFVIDYRLAYMDGIMLYDKLHTIEGLEDVPALIMSASLEQHGEELEARQLVGMEKPFDLDEFLETVKRMIA